MVIEQPRLPRVPAAGAFGHVIIGAGGRADHAHGVDLST
jgi:hypothetical protein